MWDNVRDENKPDTLTGNNRVCPYNVSQTITTIMNILLLPSVTASGLGRAKFIAEIHQRHFQVYNGRRPI